ncbi:hypothetical protein CEXT_791531 [Caerostris extrusa]|uniref:Uncharacterized protein n=1 Tax=Caerostris extrusa TaxID=172846 RepID=A0AAV4TBZ3_CAEEX|nr:hypothetical protein CEXT_791531 [Caerostris extrusa]
MFSLSLYDALLLPKQQSASLDLPTTRNGIVAATLERRRTFRNEIREVLFATIHKLCDGGCKSIKMVLSRNLSLINGLNDLMTLISKDLANVVCTNGNASGSFGALNNNHSARSQLTSAPLNTGGEPLKPSEQLADMALPNFNCLAYEFSTRPTRVLNSSSFTTVCNGQGRWKKPLQDRYV